MTTPADALFVSAGEVSGDHYIARVSERLRDSGYDGRIYGLCGSHSRESGVEALWKSERLQLIGVAEVLGSLRDILRLKGEMHRDIMRVRPKALLLADSPDFHLPLIRGLRRAGYDGRIYYLSPPSVWAWRRYRVRDLVRYVDECLPLFRFEHDYLLLEHCRSHWIGHPFAEEFAEWRPDREAVASGTVGGEPLNDTDKLVALLPGSRRGEIEQLYPILSEVYDALTSRGYSPVFSVAPGLSEGAACLLTDRLDASGRRYYRGPGRELMAASRLVVGSSGTATAEALLLKRYMVVLYRVKALSALIGKMLLGHLYFAIPNLLAGEMFYPELIQENATGPRATRAALAWLEAVPAEREAAERKMENLAALMGLPGAYDFWAERLLEALR